MNVSRADAALIVGTDKSHVNDPTAYEFNANIAADLQAASSSPCAPSIVGLTSSRTPSVSPSKAWSRRQQGAGHLRDGLRSAPLRLGQGHARGLRAAGVDDPPDPVHRASQADAALAAFQANVPTEEVLRAINVEIDFPITSYAFQYSLLGRAKANKKTIVLPEGEEDRIIKAADYLLEREIANLIIVGDKGAILARGAELGLTHLGKARFQAMDDENILKPMVAKLCELRAKKGMTEEQARKQLTDASYFGTMLVVLGYADGLVSGAVNSTANTVRPALQVIKTKPGQKLVSGAFLMCFKDHVAVFSDCAINLNPDAEQLSEIALQSAETARAFGIDPKSVCSPTPPSAPARDRTWTWSRKPPSCSRRRLRICRWSVPSSSTRLGRRPLQPPSQGQRRARTRQRVRVPRPVLRQHRLQGRAAFLRGARHRPRAAGPQQPVNDLSRGATVQDIINTIALTAIEAQ